MSIEPRLRIFKDPVSASTHFAGFLAALVGVAVLVIGSADDPARLTSMLIYGICMVTLFLASSLYHFFDVGERGNFWLRKVDHAAIFLMIGGSYVPVLIHLLDGGWRLGMLIGVGALAVAGALFKLIWFKLPEWLDVTVYCALGWSVLIPAFKIFPQLSAGLTALLVGCGAAYSLGAVVYLTEWPDPWPKRFGHHEIWHLFVLAGAGSHYVFTFFLLDRAVPPF